jgi:hypothetical protein
MAKLGITSVAIIVACIAIAVGVALREYDIVANASPPAAEENRAGTLTTQSPRKLTDAECALWAQVTPALIEKIRGTEPANSANVSAGAANARSQLLDSAVAESMRWLNAGCPAHSALGAYDWTGGHGADVRVIEWPPADVEVWTGYD